MKQLTIQEKWGRDTRGSKREKRGALDILITEEATDVYPDRRVIDIVYHGTDVGIKFYLSYNAEQFYLSLDYAEEFCKGHNQAVSDRGER